MSSKIQIRLLEADQWPLYKVMRIAALKDAPYAFSSTLEGALARSDAEWISLVSRYAGDTISISYLAFCGSTACGMAACVDHGEETEMFAVWVDPKFRRMGIGVGLIDYALHWSIARGARKITVGVYSDNPGGIALYRYAGFNHQGRVKPELSVEERRVLLLEKDITDFDHKVEQ